MSSDHDYITLDTGEKIPFSKKDEKQYLNKITVLYGGSLSGKTTLMFDILHILRKKLAIPIIFCSTTDSESNDTYLKSFPKSLIYKEVNLEKIEQIYISQKERAKKYKIANQLNVLRKLFDRVASGHDIRMSARVINGHEKMLNKIDNLKKDIATKKALKRWGEKKCNELLTTLWKDCIRKNHNKFKNFKITDVEKIALKYIDFNPHLLLIFDDCDAHAKEWSKSSVMKELFFYGRHSYITQLYTMQNDKSLPPFLRQNAHNSIFTDECSSNGFFAAKANGVSKSKQKIVEKISSRIFTVNKNGLNTYTKLIYTTLPEYPPLTVTVADQYENTKLGSTYLWEFDKKLPRKNQLMHDMENDKSYMDSFH